MLEKLLDAIIEGPIDVLRSAAAALNDQFENWKNELSATPDEQARVNIH